MWALTLLTFLWFDLEWCMIFSFITFQLPELWINALLLSLIFAMPQALWRARRGQAVIIAALCILMECNLLYARTYFNAIPLSSYGMAGNLADFTASVVDSLRLLDLGFIAIIFGAIFAARGNEDPKPSHRKAYLLLTLFLAIVSGVMLMSRGGLNRAWDTLGMKYYYYSSRVPMYSVFGSLAHDLTENNTSISQADSLAVEKFLNTRAPIDSIAGSERGSVVLILCESLESWPIGLKVQGKEITPNLNRLVADSATFYAPHILTQVGAGRSIDGQLLINAGMLPMQTGIYATEYVNNTYFTLTKALEQERGARSMLLTVDKPHTWNQQAVAQAFGIDTLVANTAWRNVEKIGSRKKLGDVAFAHQIIEKMKSGELWPEGENAYVQIVTYSGHNPFVLPEHLDSLHLNPAGLHPIALRYMTMAAYTDRAIGLLVDYIRSRTDAANTMIVITGDHEGLASERKAIHARNPFVSAEQYTPLIVLNSPRGGRFESVAGQVDIYPTLLQLAGLTNYQWHGLGTSMLSPQHPGVAVSPTNEVKGNPLPDNEPMQRLIDARRVSDRIITFNLLQQ